MFKVGGVCLGQVINADGGGYRGPTIACGQGHEAEFVDYRAKQLLTVLGAVAARPAPPAKALATHIYVTHPWLATEGEAEPSLNSS